MTAHAPLFGRRRIIGERCIIGSLGHAVAIRQVGAGAPITRSAAAMGLILAILGFAVALSALAVGVLIAIAVRLELLPHLPAGSRESTESRSLQTLLAAVHRRRA
jgi:hypothetical protein